MTGRATPYRVPFMWSSDLLTYNVQDASIDVSVRHSDDPYPAAVKLYASYGDDDTELEMDEDEARELAAALLKAADACDQENRNVFGADGRG